MPLASHSPHIPGSTILARPLTPDATLHTAVPRPKVWDPPCSTPLVLKSSSGVVCLALLLCTADQYTPRLHTATPSQNLACPVVPRLTTLPAPACAIQPRLPLAQHQDCCPTCPLYAAGPPLAGHPTHLHHATIHPATCARALNHHGCPVLCMPCLGCLLIIPLKHVHLVCFPPPTSLSYPPSVPVRLHSLGQRPATPGHSHPLALHASGCCLCSVQHTLPAVLISPTNLGMMYPSYHSLSDNPFVHLAPARYLSDPIPSFLQSQPTLATHPALPCLLHYTRT